MRFQHRHWWKLQSHAWFQKPVRISILGKFIYLFFWMLFDMKRNSFPISWPNLLIVYFLPWIFSEVLSKRLLHKRMQCIKNIQISLNFKIYFLAFLFLRYILLNWKHMSLKIHELHITVRILKFNIFDIYWIKNI